MQFFRGFTAFHQQGGKLMDRIFVIFGALSAFIGVAAGAFGAHGLKSRLSAEMLSVFEVAVRYQMYHAFALIAAAWMQSKWPSSLVTAGGWLFVIGTVLFSGSLNPNVAKAGGIQSQGV
jgi:uncharacterized membrane protein YgdD (TMEM256/DUF423 family)